MTRSNSIFWFDQIVHLHSINPISWLIQHCISTRLNQVKDLHSTKQSISTWLNNTSRLSQAVDLDFDQIVHLNLTSYASRLDQAASRSQLNQTVHLNLTNSIYQLEQIVHLNSTNSVPQPIVHLNSTKQKILIQPTSRS